MVATRGVHGEVIYIANLLRNSTLLVLLGSNVGNEAIDLLEVAESKFVKRAKTAVLVRKRVVLHPTAAGVLVEVVLCHGRRVEVLEVNACGLGFGTCCKCHKRK